jgi:hypothetical protein
MTSDEEIIYKAIDDILWNDWDPIGINHAIEARDEYSSYVSMIYNLKKSGADVDTIAHQLHSIVTKNIGLFSNIDHCIEVAKKIKDL